MGYKTTIQLALIIISVVIIATYIKPEFETLKSTQDQAAEYQVALDNAASFQAEINRIESAIESIPSAQRAALDTYLPESVDTVAVMKDIVAIASRNQMQVTSVSSEGDESDTTADSTVAAQGQSFDIERNFVVDTSQFQLNVQGTYDKFKTFLADLERNKYPLEVVSAEFTTDTEGSLYDFSLTLETYSVTHSSN